MDLDDEIRAIQEHVEALRKVLASLEERLQCAKGAWPSHQILPAEWHDRSETPPVGVIWASDGLRVWLIRSDGEPISKGAVAVKFWTTAYIPAPPSPKSS
jgi:hypothetical protein